MSNKKNDNKLSFFESFVLSGIAAFLSKTIAAPVERIKLILQSQGELIKQGKLEKNYGGIVRCTVSVYRNEGFLSFWKGNLANCLRYFPTQALAFAFKDKVKIIIKPEKTDSRRKAIMKNILAGGISGVLALPLTYSLEFTRTRLANDIVSKEKGGKAEFNGIIDVYRKIYKSEGIKGLHTGFGVTCLAIFIYRGIYFGLYDSFRSHDNSFANNFILGYGVTMTAGALIYPLDTIRRRMMMTMGSNAKYKGGFDCFLTILKTEGILTFYNGMGINVIRGISGSGVLAFFDMFSQIYLGKKVPHTSS